MLAFPASAQTSSESPNSPVSESPESTPTGSESQAPGTGTAGTESQNPSTGTAGSETQTQSQETPGSSTPAKPEAPPSTTEAQKTAAPDILIVVNKPTQIMTVTVDGHVRYHWRVSTGATNYSTPAGSYTPFRMERMHYSRECRDKNPSGASHAIGLMKGSDDLFERS
jgi:hypothetical protein